MKREPPSGFLENPTFNQWLHHKREHFASLARFVQRDRACWPDRPRTLRTLLQHLAVHEGERGVPSTDLVRKAFMQYQRDSQRGLKIPRRLGKDPLPDEKRRIVKTYSVAATTPKAIKKLESVLNVDSGGKVIDTLVERALRESR